MAVTMHDLITVLSLITEELGCQRGTEVKNWFKKRIKGVNSWTDVKISLILMNRRYFPVFISLICFIVGHWNVHININACIVPQNANAKSEA